MQPPLFEILIRKGDALLQRRSLENGEYLIGSSDDADLKFDAEGVSRKHARLFLREDGGFIEDIGSRYGTLIGGVRIEGLVPLLPEQPVKIGGLTLELRRIAEAVVRKPAWLPGSHVEACGIA